MSRQRTIVGIGESFLAEFPERTVPGGMALDAAWQSMRMGHRGLPISRLGQDVLANELLTELTARGVDSRHLQSDPDLPTARLRIQRIAGRTRAALDPRAAFDNLQWDFDLLDVAQSADAVFCGLLSQRSGQSSSVITRFYSESRAALRLADLRPPRSMAVERAALVRLLELCDGVMLSDESLELLRISKDDDAIASLIKSHDLTLALWIGADDAPTLMTSAGESNIAPVWAEETCVAGLVALTIALLDGCASAEALEIATRVAQHTSSQPLKQVPEAMLRTESRSEVQKKTRRPDAPTLPDGGAPRPEGRDSQEG